MITSKEAREIIRETHNKEIRAREEKALQFCEDLNDLIRETAEEKRGYISIEIPAEIKENVANILKFNGYAVYNKDDGFVQISW